MTAGICPLFSYQLGHGIVGIVAARKKVKNGTGWLMDWLNDITTHGIE